MKKTIFTRILSCIMCIVLIAAMALVTTSCSTKEDTPADTLETPDTSEQENVDTEEVSDVTKVGEGETSFAFTVRYADGSEDSFEVYTDETTVGAALIANGLIEGEDGAYGLYVKTVNGVTADYDVDGTYWAFYIDGEYAMTGVDVTNIVAGSSYMFAVEK